MPVHIIHIILCGIFLFVQGCSLLTDLNDPMQNVNDDRISGHQDAGKGTREPSDMVSASTPDMVYADLRHHDQDDGSRAAPPGWLDGMWLVRRQLKILKAWSQDVVLSVRIPGGWSQLQGRDLRIVHNGTELAHDIEQWVDMLDNVIWVRFPHGIDPKDTLWVYTTPKDLKWPKTTAKPGKTWNGRALHVYHFDGSGQILEQDRVSQEPNHLLKAVSSEGYTYGLPDERMGYSLKLDQDSIALESSGSTSPLHVPIGRPITVEVHVRFDDLSSTRATFLSDVNGCVGSRFSVAVDALYMHHAKGSGCVHEGHPPSSTVQAELSFSQSRVYLKHPYLMFNRIHWSGQSEHKLWMQTSTRSMSAPDHRVIDSEVLSMESQEPDLLRVPDRMLVGNWPFDDRPLGITIDTLIVHDGWLEDGELELRWLATQDNGEVFTHGKSQRLDSP